MAKLRLKAFPASLSSDGIGIVIELSLAGQPIHPTEIVEVGSTAEALRVLQDYADRAATDGRGMAVFADIMPGDRAPAGWRKLRQNDTLRYVNVEKEAA